MAFYCRKIVWVIAILLVLVLTLYCITPMLVNKKDESNRLINHTGIPYIVAHRGGRGEFPQNTLEAFYNAYSVDKNVVMETDVNITKDGVLILLHDQLLDGTTNVTGYASDWNYSDLIDRRVDFGYDNPTEDCVLAGERKHFSVDGVDKYPTDVKYPDGVEPRDDEVFLATTLEELIVAFPENLISVEIKQSGELGLKAVTEAVRLLHKHNAFDRVILVSFHSEITNEFVRLKKSAEVPNDFMFSPGIIGIAKFYALYTLGLDHLYLENVSVLQIPMEEYGFNFAAADLIAAAHEKDIAVQYWTINDEDEMRHLIEIGADGIMTDYPSKLKAVLDETK